MRCGETTFSTKQITQMLGEDGFVPGTKPFKSEFDRRYLPTSTRTFFVDNPGWDGTRLQNSDYHVDGTLKTAVLLPQVVAR